MKKYRVAFHLNEVEKVDLAMRNINNLLDDLGEDEVDVVLITHGKAIASLGKSGPLEGLMRDLNRRGVVFGICGNTMRNRGLTEDDFPEIVEVVSSGVGELVRRQAEGWAYLRP
jgi:uncharacterized protein